MKKMISLMATIAAMVIIGCGGDDEKTAEGAFDCSGIFPNGHDGICWSDKAADLMNWDDAKTYCKNLGGHLPTIDELRTLIINCPGTETGGACKVSDPAHLAFSESDDCYCDGSAESHSVFGDTGWTWSSSVQSDSTDGAWLVLFSSGSVGTYYKSSNIYVRCVR